MSTAKKAWERRPGESTKAYEAFAVYLGMGPSRSIAKAVKSLGRPAGYARTCEQWSSKFEWRHRAAAFDESELLEQIERRAQTREKVRQIAYDEAAAAMSRLLDLARGKTRKAIVK